MSIREGSHDPPSRLALAVRHERDRRKWTSGELASRSGLTHSWVRNFEAGIIQNPAIDKIRALEQAFKMRLGELYAEAINISYDELIALARAENGVEVPWDRLLSGLSTLAEQQSEILDLLRDNNERLSTFTEAAQTSLRGIERSAHRGVSGGGKPDGNHPAEGANG